MVALSDALGALSAEGETVIAKINVEGAAGEMILGTTPSDWSGVSLPGADVEENNPVVLPAITERLRS